MALTGTTTELLEAIRQDARVADDDPSATDEILLAEATRVLHRTYVPAVRKCRSDYYLSTAHIALEAGRAAYPIPRRSTTSTIRRVRVLNTAGIPQAQLPPASLEDFGHAVATTPAAYAVTDSQIVVFPTPNAATQVLEVMFEYRPSQLILPANVLDQVVVVNYDAGTNVWSISTVTNALADGDVFDIVRADAPFSTPVIDAVAFATGAGLFGYGVELVTYMGTHPIGVTGTGWASASSPINVQTLDYVCTAGESPIPQIPIELHPCLAMHTAAKWLTPIDPQGAEQLKANADADMVAVLEAMTPRQQGTQQRMRPRVRHVRTGGAGFRRPGGTFGDLS